jgi:uncharacterized protein (TIGR02001 family)
MRPRAAILLAALFAAIHPAWAAEIDAGAAEPAAPPPTLDVLGLASIPGSLALTLTYTSRYVSRGFDFDRGRATPQAYLEYDHPAGYYAGVFATKTNYLDLKAEIDFSLGYRSSVGKFSYDVGLYYYYYPRTSHDLHVDYRELGFKAAYDFGFVSPDVEVYVSDDYFFGAGKSVFVTAGPDVPFLTDFTASARVGYLRVEDSAKFIYPNYLTWLFAIDKDFRGFTFGAQYSNTSISRRQCLGENVRGEKLLFRVAKSF